MEFPVIAKMSIIFLALFVSQENFESDTFQTSNGALKITFIGHGTLMMEFDGKTIHIDPVARYADYSKLPKADLILITHEHGDHLDADAISKIKKESTKIILTKKCFDQFGSGTILNNGESVTFAGIKIDAVPAYNIQHKRSEGNPFHPKGAGNGYVLHFGDKKVYVAGDTENIPEMANLENIDIAFLPMNLPYTMTPEMVADAANMIHPKILYPYHFGNTDTQNLVDLMKDQNKTEIRIRKLN
jgi:L-ascorbate metabolism protein UlaG (beta-lactamase superfamily)